MPAPFDVPIVRSRAFPRVRCSESGASFRPRPGAGSRRASAGLAQWSRDGGVAARVAEWWPCQDAVVLAVDGNSLVHRSYHAQAHTGQPSWAVRGLLTQLVAAVERIAPGRGGRRASTTRTGRRGATAGRPTRPTAPRSSTRSSSSSTTPWRAMRELGVAVVVPPGLEADDVLASTAAFARRGRRAHRRRHLRPRRVRPHRRHHARAAHHQRRRRGLADDDRRPAGAAARGPPRPVPRLRRPARRPVGQPARRAGDRPARSAARLLARLRHRPGRVRRPRRGAGRSSARAWPGGLADPARPGGVGAATARS